MGEMMSRETGYGLEVLVCSLSVDLVYIIIGKMEWAETLYLFSDKLVSHWVCSV